VFILPLNEDGYIGRRAYVLLGLVVLNALALAATYILPASSDAVFQQYGFVPAHPHLSTLLSSMFLHTGFWHLAGNIFFLWMFGLPRGEYLRPLAIWGALHHLRVWRHCAALPIQQRVRYSVRRSFRCDLRHCRLLLDAVSQVSL
jgi:hypothetical protein